MPVVSGAALGNMLSKEASKKRMQRAQRMKPIPLKSSMMSFRGIPYEGDHREPIRILKRLYREMWYQDVTSNWQLKKPQGSPEVVPEIYSNRSLDVYYGKDVDVQPEGGDPNHVVRYAYATGSGVGSIGQDPKTRKVLPWKGEFTTLQKYVCATIQHSSRYSAEEKEQLIANVQAQNGVNAKWYFGIQKPGRTTNHLKDTEWHVDVALRPQNNSSPQGANSQVVGTPVIMCTYGGHKRLCIGLGKNKNDMEKDLCFYHDQGDSKFYLLHGEDEKWRTVEWRGRKRFLHMSTMHPQNQDGVVLSIMFRNVENTATVHRDTANYVNPPARSDMAEFDAIRDTWQDNPKVRQDQALLTAKVEMYLRSHHI